MKNYSYSRKLLCSAVAAVSMTSADIALSQALEEVVVTARKRAESMQQVPMAVAAFNADQLQDFQVENIVDLQKMTPNVTINENSGLFSGVVQIYIRGIGTEPGFDQGVGIYVDDVYLNTASGGLLSVYDIQTIEVLKGPQGHLYGRNTIGGAIKYISRAPSENLEGDAELKYGEDNLIQFKGNISGPLIGDTLLGGLGFMHRETDDFQDNLYDGSEWGGQDITALRGTLLWNASDNVSVNLVADFLQDDSTATIPVRQAVQESNDDFSAGTAVFDFLYTGAEAIYGPGTSIATSGQIDLPYDNRIYKDLPGNDEDTVNTAFVDLFDQAELETQSIAATVVWDIDDQWSLKSVSAYREVDHTRMMDFSGSPQFIIYTLSNHKYEDLSQEFQLNYSSDNLQGVAGVYYLDSIDKIGSNGDVSGSTSLLRLVEDRIEYLPKDDRELTSISAYFNIDWDFTEDWQLSIGGRYTKDEKELNSVKDIDHVFYPFANTWLGEDLVPFGINTLDPANIAIVESSPLFDSWVVAPVTIPVSSQEITDVEDDWSEFTPSFRLTHFLSQDTMVYAGYSSGFKSGGFANESGGVPYDPETVDSYVLGLKTDLLEGTLRINTEIFFNDYKDKQLGVIELQEDNSLLFTRNNVGEVESTGFESEITWITPLTGLSFNFNVGYLDTDIKELIEAGEDLADDHALGFQPEWTGLVRGNYAFDLARGNVFITADVAYRDEMYTDSPINITSDFEKHALSDSLTTVNASIAYRTDDDKWRVALEGKNLTDERELVNTFTVSNWMGGGYNQQRIWALSVGYTF